MQQWPAIVAVDRGDELPGIVRAIADLRNQDRLLRFRNLRATRLEGFDQRHSTSVLELSDALNALALKSFEQARGDNHVIALSHMRFDLPHDVGIVSRVSSQ